MSRPGRSRPASAAARAFTLIELLVVTSIILILVSTLVVATMAVRKRTMQNVTQRLVLQLSMAVETYHERYGEYPPDGYGPDEIKVFDEKIEGSQCLVYCLALPQPTISRNPDGTVRRKVHEPIWQDIQVGDLEFPLSEMEERKRVPRILDGYGVVPIFYDRVATPDEFTPLTWEKHPDPRTIGGKKPESLKIGAFQIWSLGPDGRDPEGGDPSDDILSWEIR